MLSVIELRNSDRIDFRVTLTHSTPATHNTQVEQTTKQTIFRKMALNYTVTNAKCINHQPTQVKLLSDLKPYILINISKQHSEIIPAVYVCYARVQKKGA